MKRYPKLKIDFLRYIKGKPRLLRVFTLIFYKAGYPATFLFRLSNTIWKRNIWDAFENRMLSF